MGKHTTRGTTARPRPPALPLPIRSTVRLRRPVDIWHKAAFSAAGALAVPDLTLLALGRLDLVLYTSAGAMCALYAHGRPYAARARALALVVLGMVASLGVALLCAASVSSPALLVALAALLAAAHKVLCDATRIGPPGNLILTFISSSAFFVPQRLADVPFHLALALGGGALAWLICMAPRPFRPHGPERVAVARGLEASAALWRAREPAVFPARRAAAGAVGSAWHTLFLVPGDGPERAGLERLLVHAESALAAGAPHAAEADRCAALARALRRGRALPTVVLTPRESEEAAGVAAERHARGQPRRPAPDGPRGIRAVRDRLRPGSPLLPVGARVAAGCALAGWVSLAAGVGHPYWAVVTAASLYQANTTLSWQRAVQRVLGNVLGLVLFLALLPLIRTGHLAMVLLALAFQIGAEALITRNYWLGSVCVTPMALLLTEFGGGLPAHTLVHDRMVDTLVGAAVGLACCVLVTNRRAADRTDRALAAVEAARQAALRLADGAGAGWTEEAGRARDRLAHCLVELRDAFEVASGEWWQRALPVERVAAAESEGHRTLALLVRRTAPVAPVP
ncbi:FUSC family protein [Streptomyces corynorhini]|uniref:FUSC family protein n=1 Tax=Streptomyces corynorhini TaxID=2282652 RepID=A0A370BD03_9ACTN|nr:FUSC family protein [Streptomyces corynorhini]RDG39638.1 FUSC family protein [Streptomyces corynorhini]